MPGVVSKDSGFIKYQLFILSSPGILAIPKNNFFNFGRCDNGIVVM